MMEKITKEFIKYAKKLEDEGIFPEEILADEGIIPKQNNYPPVEIIKKAGYSYDGNGNVIGIRGNIMKGFVDPANGYTMISISYCGYRKSKQFDGKDYGTICPSSTTRSKSGSNNYYQTAMRKHTLIFGLYHGRWPRRGLVIDHFDNNKLNDHHSNLIEGPSKDNQHHNKMRAHGQNKTSDNEDTQEIPFPLAECF